MKDRGSITNPGVELREQIKKLAAKATQDVDQVLLGIVTDAGDGQSVEVALDGFSAGPVPATWATPVTAAVDQRVSIAVLKGGQNFFVVGVIGGSVSAGNVALDDLTDVTITGGADKHALMRNGAGQYVNRVLVEADISDLGSYSLATHDHDLDYSDILHNHSGVYLEDITAENIADLSDVTGSATNRHVLVQNGAGQYVGRALVEADISDLGSYSLSTHNHAGTYLEDITGENIADLSDVTGSATNRHVLVQNGAGVYVGRALVEADISDLGSYSLSSHNHDADYVELGGDTMTGVLQVPSGTNLLPSIAIGFADTGFYAPGDLGATVDGVLVHAWSGSFERSYQPHRFADGTVALPGLTFASDTNTGWHRPSADVMAAVVGAVDPFQINKRGWTVDVSDDYLPSWQAIAPANKTTSFTTSAWTDLDGSEKIIWDHTGTNQTVLAKAHAVCNFAETNTVGTEVRLRVGISFAGTGGTFNYGSEGQMWAGRHTDGRASGYRAHVTAMYLGYGTATGDVVMKTQYWVGAAPDAMYGNYSIGEAYGTHT